MLGLVTTKTSQIEPLDQLKARLGQARSVVDADRLALSPHCGFATSVTGNAITAEAQRAKLALLVRAARDFLPPEPDLNPSRGPWRAIRVPSARAPR